MGNVYFCTECRKDVQCDIIDVEMKGVLKDVEYSYIGKKAICKDCGSEVYIDEVSDYNLEALKNVYRRENDIISLEDILSIPKKYDIGKRPLSTLLGWGEMTFTRYCDGYLPTKQYSEILKSILNSPSQYLTLLEQNKDRLSSDLTYEKSKKAVELLLQNEEANKSKIDMIIDYILCVSGDITPLALQKLLYYIQGFCYAFTNNFIFDNDCEAWVHGPVYREIYFKYNHYEYDPIKPSRVCENIPVSETEKAVIDSVLKNFGCYSGKVLENFTHSETPWLETRGDLPNKQPSNKIIPKNLIGEYFSEAKNICRMVNPLDIKIYARRLFEQCS